MINPQCVCDIRGILELTNFQEDFREALPYWLNQEFSTTQERVERAVQVDQVSFLKFYAKCLLQFFQSKFFLSFTAPPSADWCYTNKTQLFSCGSGGMYPAYLPTVGEALLAWSWGGLHAHGQNHWGQENPSSDGIPRIPQVPRHLFVKLKYTEVPSKVSFLQMELKSMHLTGIKNLPME